MVSRVCSRLNGTHHYFWRQLCVSRVIRFLSTAEASGGGRWHECQISCSHCTVQYTGWARDEIYNFTFVFSLFHIVYRLPFTVFIVYRPNRVFEVTQTCKLVIFALFHPLLSPLNNKTTKQQNKRFPIRSLYDDVSFIGSKHCCSPSAHCTALPRPHHTPRTHPFSNRTSCLP